MLTPLEGRDRDPSPPGGGEESTLADYWNVFVNQWKLFVALVSLFLVAGVAYWKSIPIPPFPHTTTIEIGSITGGALIVTPIETAAALRAKLESAYIPSVLKDQAQQEGYTEERYNIVVEVPEGSIDLLILRSYGYEEVTPTLLALLQKVDDLVLKDHARSTEEIKRKHQEQVLHAKLELEELQEQKENVFTRERDQLNEQEKLLKKQVAALEASVLSLENDRAKALDAGTRQRSFDQSLATALLFINSQISGRQEKLDALENRLYVKLVGDRAALDQRERSSSRAQQEKEQEIANLEAQNTTIKETRVLNPPNRSQRKSKKGPLQTVSLFGGIGFLSALFAVLAVEFAVDARKKVRRVS